LENVLAGISARGMRILVALSPWDNLQWYLVAELQRQHIWQVDAVTGIACDGSLRSRLIYRFGAAVQNEHLILSRALREADLESYDYILVNEVTCASNIIRYIRSRNSQAQLFYVMWNTADTHKHFLYDFKKDFLRVVSMQESGRVAVVSFDAGDCRRYGLRFNGQVVPFFAAEAPDGAAAYGAAEAEDCFFCGVDKGRLPILRNLAEELAARGITYRFLLAPQRRHHYTAAERPWLTLHEQIPYDQMVRELWRHRVIVDIVQAEQQGLTWRPIEALFYHKKLITNFAAIKDYDFYRHENIFILGEDRMEDFAAFVRQPYVPLPEQMVQQYQVTDWLERLITGETMANYSTGFTQMTITGERH